MLTGRILCILIVPVLFTGPMPTAEAQLPEAERARLTQFALTHAGDAERGAALFAREEVTRCLACHRVNGKGGLAGPDLTSIGGKFDRPHLIESLLEPSRQIVEGYRTSVLVMTDGRVFTGIVRDRSDVALKLFDGKTDGFAVRMSDVEDMKTSDVSLMPGNLAKDLSPEEFTDIVAYLESLRPGGQPKFGAGISGPIRVPDGFAVDVVCTGLTGATAMEILPDGRVLICEQPGAVRVVRDGRLLSRPLISLPVDDHWERGVIGVTVDPLFPAEPWVYVCRVVAEPYPHHLVSRFRVSGDTADPDSEQILLTGDNQQETGGKVPAGHQGGGLHFGSDGCLYVSIGEHTAERPAQDLNSFLGKILRIHPDGQIPPDNPFVTKARDKYRAVWALGCRNPFTFAIRRTDGFILLNDVGGKFEEINVGRAGANYGWPSADHGPLPKGSPFDGPLYWYPQASISGGDFAPTAESLPDAWHGDYFFADFVLGWIRRLDPDDPGQAEDFATGLRRPVDLRFASDGSLYVLLRNAWVVDDKFVSDTGSLLRISRSVGSE